MEIIGYRVMLILETGEVCRYSDETFPTLGHANEWLDNNEPNEEVVAFIENETI
jgi:hypothetical protein